jgi:hypothetical protein
MKNTGFAFFLILVFAASLQSALGQSVDEAAAALAASADTAVPSLIRYSGTALQNDGKPRQGEASVTFLIFKEEKGGEPLWAETQTVSADQSGAFSVQLGAASLAGMPSDLFSTGEARWLEVQVAGSAPQPRTLLSSVPYAMKSADAESLAGHQAADFVTQAQLEGLAQKLSKVEQAAAPAFQPELTPPSGSGTTNTVPLWTSSSTLGNSTITQSGNKIGINFAAPTSTLEVGGAMTVHGTLTFPPGVPATPAASSQSQSFSFSASAWNSTTSAPVSSTYTLLAGPVGNNTATPNAVLYLNYQNGTSPVTSLFTMSGKGLLGLANPAGGISSYGNISLSPLNWATSTAASNSPLLEIGASSFSSTSNAAKAQTFAWQAQAAGNDTASPTGSLALLFGENGGAPAATGLSFAPNGIISFVNGQTFPGGGGGTITAVTTASPLSGGASKGSVALSLNLPALETSLNSQYAQLAAPNTFTQPITFAAAQTFPGTGTITGVTAGTGLIGGGTTGSVKLSIDATKIPSLTGSPVFNGSAGDGVVGDTAGTAVGTAGVIGVAGAGNTSGFSGIAGLWGNASAHVGVLGTSDQYPGVVGFSSNNYGVQGSSTSGSGVQGSSSGTVLNTAGVLGDAGVGSGLGHVVAGVWGDSYQQAGVEGTSNQSVGVYGQSNVGYGVQGVSGTSNGVLGTSTSNFGVYGTSSSSTGAGGYTSGYNLNTAGVEGVATSNNTSGFGGIAGVWGDAAAHVGVLGSSDQYAGVQGLSNSGPGVQGVSTTSFGGQFTASSNSAAVYAVNNGSTPGSAFYGNTSGTDASALFAESDGAGGKGVYGIANGGADSSNTQPIGVYGYSNGIGVEGYSTGPYGVYGYSSANGVFGQVGSPTGVFGFAGVQGNSYGAEGGFFASVQAFGVEGLSYNNVGVQGYSDTSNAGSFQNNKADRATLLAYNASEGDVADANLFNTFEAASPHGACGFSGKGDLTCTGQVKSLTVTRGGSRTVETYSMQSPENWMEDFGSGTLHRGVAIIRIDTAFAETITATADYHVFITPNGDCKGLYVIAKTAGSFEVRESGGGTASLTFDYRIVAKRRGLESERMIDVTDKLKTERARLDLQTRAEATAHKRQ